jgi:hypothetical protein
MTKVNQTLTATPFAREEGKKSEVEYAVNECNRSGYRDGG